MTKYTRKNFLLEGDDVSRGAKKFPSEILGASKQVYFEAMSNPGF